MYYRLFERAGALAACMNALIACINALTAGMNQGGGVGHDHVCAILNDERAGSLHERVDSLHKRRHEPGGGGRT